VSEHATLAYSTSTGERRPRSHLALVAARELTDNEPAPRIRRTAAKRQRWPVGTRRNGAVVSIQVDPVLMAAAREAMRPGQRLVPVSATEVWLVNRRART